MRELSSIDLEFISGGLDMASAARHALGTFSSALGYMTGIHLKQSLGFRVHGTVEGVTGAAVLGEIATHSLWDRAGMPLDDRLSSGFTISFLCGVGAAFAEEITKKMIAITLRKE